MNTLTIFNAYAAARDGLHEVCVIVAGGDMPNDELARFVRMGARLERQCKTFDAAMRHRLAKCTLVVQLADVQCALISEKNDEVASLKQHVADLEAALRHTQSHSYADDLLADSEAGTVEVQR